MPGPSSPAPLPAPATPRSAAARRRLTRADVALGLALGLVLGAGACDAQVDSDYHAGYWFEIFGDPADPARPAGEVALVLLWHRDPPAGGQRSFIVQEGPRFGALPGWSRMELVQPPASDTFSTLPGSTTRWAHADIVAVPPGKLRPGEIVRGDPRTIGLGVANLALVYLDAPVARDSFQSRWFGQRPMPRGYGLVTETRQRYGPGALPFSARCLPLARTDEERAFCATTPAPEEESTFTPLPPRFPHVVHVAVGVP